MACASRCGIPATGRARRACRVCSSHSTRPSPRAWAWAWASRSQYEALIHATGEIRIGSIGLSKSLEHWINDGLMAVFFVLVGLEIKREAIEGSLAGVQKAALPVMAAIGGFVLPTLFYAALNWGDSQALRGWAVPNATDIAFVIGICAMLG